jgi:uncharacterized damage-inducible protein DinB
VNEPLPFDIAARFIERSRHYLCVEYPAKIAAALRTVPPDLLWWRPNETSNSAGNLVLHLNGNVRQWVLAGIGGHPDLRRRDIEFAARGGAECETLLAGLSTTCAEVDAILSRLTASQLGEPRSIQGRETTVFAALYHVVEHFSGHTGQIILLAKSLTPGAVRFYDDTGGLARPLFLADGAQDVD